LKYLARRHLGFEMQTWLDVKVKPELMQEYTAMDSVATYLLWEKWEDQLPEHFWTIDMPLLPVIMAIEDRGVAINPNKLGEMGEYLAKAIEEIKAANLLPLHPFSPLQVQSYVYGELGIEPFKFTPTGQPSVEEEVLETIDDPVVKKILEYKGLYKEKDTYVENYVERLTLDNRVHPEFKQCRTATGRLSCARPNLQNVPKTEMRTLFVAPPGKKLIRVDWKQIELIVLAIISGDEEMLRVLTSSPMGDIHQATADALGLSRYDGKTFNFAMIYRAEPWTLSQEFHIPIDQAKSYMARYFEKYPGIRRYYTKIEEEAGANKKLYNLFGRMRRFDALYAEDWRVRKQGLKEAINFPIQSTAGEIVKLSMIDLDNKHSAPMILQVHDELLFEVDEKDTLEYAHWLEEYIPTLVEIEGVRFPVDVSIGNNWWEAMNA